MFAQRSRGVVRGASALASAAIALALTGCASEGATGADPRGTTSEDLVAEAKANVETFFGNSGTEMSTEGLLPNNLEGKRVFYLSSYLSSPSGTAGVESLKQIAKDLGFELTAFDGAFSPAKYQEGMREALAGDYDGVILYGVDCPGQEQPLKDLQAAGIPVATISGADCDVQDPSAEPLFTSDVLYPLPDGKTGNSVDMYEAWGASQADYLIAKTNGEAKVILFELPDFYVTKALADGFRDRIAECEGCTVVEEVEVLAADLGAPSLAEKADQALLKHPEATAVNAGYDDLLTLGVANSIVQAGRAESLIVVGGTGLAPALDLLRRGKGVNAGWGYDYAWDHYAAVAALMSGMEGEPAPAVGTPVIWYDAENNLPDSGDFVPEYDFRAAFESAWTGQ